MLDVSGNYELTVPMLIEPYEPSENAELKRLRTERRNEKKLKVRIGGTAITREYVDEMGLDLGHFDLDFIDASIKNLRTDAHMVPVDWEYDDDYDDYEDDDSFGEGGDLDDFDDPVEEFERNWMS